MKDIIHRKRVLTLIAILLACMLMLAGCESVAEEQYEEVTATVTELRMQSAYTTSSYSSIFKKEQVQFHPSSYYVTATYEDLSQKLDSKSLYDSVKIGDTIQVVLYKGWNQKGELIKRELRIP